MEIRKPEISDKETVMRILADNMSPRYMPEMEEEFHGIISGKYPGFVVCEKGKPVGYITCRQTTQTYKLETMAVDKAYLGKGIGKELLHHLENHLSQSSGSEIILNVVTDDASDDPVQEFYKKCGFRVSGIVEDECSPGDRQVHLSKRIARNT